MDLLNILGKVVVTINNFILEEYKVIAWKAQRAGQVIIIEV